MYFFFSSVKQGVATVNYRPRFTSLSASVDSLSFQAGLEQKCFHSVHLFAVISIQQLRKKETYVTTQTSAITVFLAYSLQCSIALSQLRRSYRTVVTERRTYTFHEPCSMLDSLEINFLLPGAICVLLLATWNLSQPTAESKAKYFGLLFGVVHINRVSLFDSPAAEPQWNAAVAAWDTNRVAVPQLKQRLRHSQIAGVLYSNSLLAICSWVSGAFGAVTQWVKTPGGEDSNSEVSLVIVAEHNWVPHCGKLWTYALSNLNCIGLHLLRVIITYYTVKMKGWIWKL